MRTWRHFLTLTCVLVTILCIRFPTAANGGCEEGEIWDGNECVSVEEVAESCIDLPDNQQRFCIEVVRKRLDLFAAYSALDIPDTTIEESRLSFGEDTSQTAAIASLHDTNVDYLCFLDNDSVQCLALSSVVAFVDNEAASNLLNDLRHLTFADAVAEEYKDLFLICGNGIYGTVSLADMLPDFPEPVEPGSYENPLDPSWGTAPALDEWWKEVFSNEGGQRIAQQCDELREEVGAGIGGISHLHFGTSVFGFVSLDQCGPISEADFTYKEFADAVLENAARVHDTCRSIMPASGSWWDAVVDFVRDVADAVSDFVSTTTSTTREVVRRYLSFEEDGVKYEYENLRGTRTTVTTPSGATGRLWRYVLPDGRIYYEWDVRGVAGSYDWVVIPKGAPRDCLDPAMCDLCQSFARDYMPDALDCLTGWADPRLCQQTLRNATACCSVNPFGVPADPTIVLPNPEGGFECYAAMDPTAARENYCGFTCGVAAMEADCYEDCMTRELLAINFELMDKVCIYMLSEACWEASVPEELLAPLNVGPSWGQGGPPMPFSVGEITLIPDMIPQLDELGITPHGEGFWQPPEIE